MDTGSSAPSGNQPSAASEPALQSGGSHARLRPQPAHGREGPAVLRRTLAHPGLQVSALDRLPERGAAVRGAGEAGRQAGDSAEAGLVLVIISTYNNA